MRVATSLQALSDQQTKYLHYRRAERSYWYTSVRWWFRGRGRGLPRRGRRRRWRGRSRCDFWVCFVNNSSSRSWKNKRCLWVRYQVRLIRWIYNLSNEHPCNKQSILTTTVRNEVIDRLQRDDDFEETRTRTTATGKKKMERTVSMQVLSLFRQ